MAFVKRNREMILRSIPEDVKRYLKREIESCNSGATALHYKFAHYLLTKYELIMDIWLASESTASEIEEIRKAHDFCLKSTDGDNNLIWICQGCKSVVGSFKQIIPGVTEGDFTQFLLAMIESCPICQSESRVLLKKGFLLSGGNLEQAMGKPVPEMDKDYKTHELLWITLRGMNTDLKKSIQEMAALTGENTLKDMIMKGRIQNIAQKDDNGNYWNVFGKLTPEDMKRFRLS
ncbi:MAG: hypothetical protein IMF10_00425 [Proteobacteria bacterium]|jgi:rubrerythrin|nr:hypothetical protein [Pseudomonadota bacterium]